MVEQAKVKCLKVSQACEVSKFQDMISLESCVLEPSESTSEEMNMTKKGNYQMFIQD